MAERFKGITNQIVETWKSWTKKQKTVLLSAIAAVVIAIGIIVFAVSRPNYQVLTTCKDYSELNSVISLLNENNIQNQVEDNTLVVKVDKNNLTNAKMLIASADVQPDGYTFQDAMESSFTTTESDKTKMYQHYLESKFANDLSLIDGVKSATVTVSIPEASNSFYAVAAETSVAVCLDTSKGISDEVSEGMANFIATAVGNSTTNNITIIDNKGNTLYSGPSNASSNSGVSYAGKLKHKAQIEETTTNKLRRGLLATGLYNEVYLALDFDLDWDEVNKIATEYTTQGDDQAIFDESYEEESQGTAGASGAPGTVSNDDDTTYDIDTGNGSTSTYSVKKYKYLPNSLVTTTTTEPGGIVKENSTLAVSFIRNRIYNENEVEALGLLEGTTWEQFKIDNAASIAQQVDDTWLDFLSAGTGVPRNNISVIAYEVPFFEDAPPSNVAGTVTFWLQIALAAIILGLLAFVIIRSARPLTVEETEPELSVEEMLATARENQPSVEEIIENEKSETRKAIEKFVDENPEAVALLLRNWLNEGWE